MWAGFIVVKKCPGRGRVRSLRERGETCNVLLFHANLGFWDTNRVMLGESARVHGLGYGWSDPAKQLLMFPCCLVSLPLIPASPSSLKRATRQELFVSLIRPLVHFSSTLPIFITSTFIVEDLGSRLRLFCTGSFRVHTIILKFPFYFKSL